jgi:hypothetical protein
MIEPRLTYRLLSHQSLLGLVDGAVVIPVVEAHPVDFAFRDFLPSERNVIVELKSLPNDDTHLKRQPIRLLNDAISRWGARDTTTNDTS